MIKTKLDALVRGIKLKIESTGQTIEDILETYTKLTEEEKQEVREAVQTGA